MNERWHDQIESDPLILRGKPCFRGTRIPVGLILGYMACGKTAEEITREFPDLTAGHLTAALEYARDLADFEAVDFEAAALQ